MHRFVLAEFNTHRVFSRNSASSRAIPFQKQVDRVLHDPAIPIKWASEQPGMSGGDELDVPERATAIAEWLLARNAAVRNADSLANLGVHKSVCNRLLEPFLWHTVIVTSTEWDNFFELRCNPAAQPEMRVAAEAMREAYEESNPTDINGWHMPYMDEQALYDCEASGEDPRYVSAAKCARVSYLTHDGRRDVQKDADLYRRLVENRHLSPLEHVARPCQCLAPMRHLGNFHGWDQLRHMEGL